MSNEELGTQRNTKTPADSIEVAENMEQLQLKHMKDSQSLQSVIKQILEVYKEIAEVVSHVRVHRVVLAQQLEAANQLYINLFERLLSEVLMMQRLKFRSQTGEIQECKTNIAELESSLVYEKKENRDLKTKSERLNRKVDETLGVLRSRELEIALLRQEIANLEKYRDDYNG